MNLSFTYAYTDETEKEIQLSVSAKYFKGYAATREQPEEAEEMEIVAVVGPDGFVYDDNDLLEDWPKIEEKAWQELEKENDRYDNARAKQEKQLAEIQNQFYYFRF